MMNTGGGLDMSRSTRDLVIQGQVQDPDLATAEVVLGQPVAPPSPTTTRRWEATVACGAMARCWGHWAA